MGGNKELKTANDPYNGIFYKTKESKERTTIEFVSVLLFELYLGKMQSDFQLSSDVLVYRINTKSQKTKVHLILNSASMTVEISEAGHRSWTEDFICKTVPTLMSQLVQRTNYANGVDVDTVDLCQEVGQEVQDQANETDVLKELEAKIHQLRAQRSQKKKTYAATTKEGLRATDEGKSIPTIRKNVLLVGDSIINRVNSKGLRYNVHKHSVPGATIRSLMSEVQLFDLSRFDTVIAYVGGNDVAQQKELELIEEEYDQFVAMLGASKPNMRVILSKVAPRGDADVSRLNSVIERLCIHYHVEFVDIFRAFHDDNGIVCARYIDQDQIHPSISGVKRILGTINSAIEIVHSFDSAVFVKKQFGSHSGHSYRRNVVQLGQSSPNCLKCGETNHQTFTCRHRVPITCWSCGIVGHKHGHCLLYQ